MIRCLLGIPVLLLAVLLYAPPAGAASTPTLTRTPSSTRTATVTRTATETETETPLPTEIPTDTETVTPEPVVAPPYFYVDRNVFAPVLGQRVRVSWSLRRTGRVQIRIYDSAGEVVVRKFRDETSPGGEIRSAVWDGRNDDDAPCASGVYVFRVFAPDLLEHYSVAIVQ